jgi:signal transduction histidine kinase|tara:strand:+ start:269 stop:973 length:705 start_codon:yes stop_codon:yes gene_type:complete
MSENKDEFLEISRIKEEFIANASHELKTPIASVRLAAESALRSLELKDGMAITFLEQILRDSDRMNDLISDLLDLSSMETRDIDMEEIDLHDIISEEISYLSKQNKKRIGYKRYKVSIFANYDDISIAVKNLIKNALKYSPPEENIFVKIEEDEVSVKCSFEDYGSGISKGDKEKIFERFYRVDKGRSRKLGGTGLGLAIVKHALERNNATIEIDSKLGFGSKFTIVFTKVNVK